MPDFKAKMHQIRFRQTPLGELTSLPTDPIARFEGPTSKGGGNRGEDERGGKGGSRRDGKRGGEGEGREEDAFLVMWPRRLSALNPPCWQCTASVCSGSPHCSWEISLG